MKHQEMTINIMGKEVLARTDGMIEFKSIETAGNAVRLSKGKPIKNISRFMDSSAPKELIEALINKRGGCEDDYYRVEGRGNMSRRLVCIELAIHIAMHMDADFELEIIEAFIEGKILSNRLDGGDKFKALNMAIDDYLPEREGKPSNKGVYIQVAKLIREKCNVEAGTLEEPIWNGFSADTVSQQMRVDIEQKLIMFLKMGFIRNYQHMKEVIEQL